MAREGPGTESCDLGTNGPARGRADQGDWLEPQDTMEGRPMYERILVAIDDSAMAQQVLVAAQELATLSSGEVWVFHVREGDPSKHPSQSAHTSWDAYAMVDAAVDKLVAAGVTAHAEVSFNL